MAPLNPEILALLVCPACRGKLSGEAADAMICLVCGRVYPVRDAIPVLIAAAAPLPGGTRM